MKTTPIEIGDVYYNNAGDKATVVREIRKGSRSQPRRLEMKFNDGTLIDVSSTKVKGGSWKNPMKPVVYGVGFMGQGDHVSSIRGNETRAYTMWNSMLGRCYCENTGGWKFYGLKGVTVCDEWHNYQNFAEWFHNNYYYTQEVKLSIDKDLKTFFNGKLHYSPETTCILPVTINAALASIKKDIKPRKEGNAYSAHREYKGESSAVGRSYSKDVVEDMILTSKILQLLDIRHEIDSLKETRHLLPFVNEIIKYYFEEQSKLRVKLDLSIYSKA